MPVHSTHMSGKFRPPGTTSPVRDVFSITIRPSKMTSPTMLLPKGSSQDVLTPHLMHVIPTNANNPLIVFNRGLIRITTDIAKTVKAQRLKSSDIPGQGLSVTKTTGTVKEGAPHRGHISPQASLQPHLADTLAAGWPQLSVPRLGYLWQSGPGMPCGAHNCAEGGAG